jgi:tRNA-2-methylthio-N6-dimethylallyladenosine synthase
VGRIVKVLVERQSTKSPEDMMGHSTCHKVVNFPGPQNLAGQIVEVRINEAKVNSLYGEVI